jgi:hypothetical protein
MRTALILAAVCGLAACAHPAEAEDSKIQPQNADQACALMSEFFWCRSDDCRAKFDKRHVQALVEQCNSANQICVIIRGFLEQNSRPVPRELTCNGA